MPSGVFKKSDVHIAKLRAHLVSHNKRLGELKRGKKRPEISGENSGKWRGGRVIDYNGFVRIYKPDHPNCDCKGYVYEHRLVMEQHIGRLLTRNEMVKHNNNDRQDNRIENLRITVGYEVTPTELIYRIPTDDTKIGYLAGFFVGEGHFKIGASRAKSKSLHYGIAGQISITNKDLDLINQSKRYLDEFGIKSSISTPAIDTYRLNISGWKMIDNFIMLVYEVISGQKKEQFRLYIEKFRPLLFQRSPHTYTDFFRMWTPELFIEAMGIVDEINSYKQHNRGIQNQEYFKKILNIT